MQLAEYDPENSQLSDKVRVLLSDYITALKKEGDRKKTKEIFKTKTNELSLELDGVEDPDILSIFGSMLLWTGYRVRGVRMLQELVEKGDNAVDILYAGNTIYRESLRLKEAKNPRRIKDHNLDDLAMALYEKARNLEPFNSEAWLGVAKVLDLKNEKGEKYEEILKYALLHGGTDFEVITYAPRNLIHIVEMEEEIRSTVKPALGYLALKIGSEESLFERDIISLVETTILLDMKKEEAEASYYWGEFIGDGIEPLLFRADFRYDAGRDLESALRLYKEVLERNPEHEEAKSKLESIFETRNMR